jgi:hypothetical protein
MMEDYQIVHKDLTVTNLIYVLGCNIACIYGLRYLQKYSPVSDKWVMKDGWATTLKEAIKTTLEDIGYGGWSQTGLLQTSYEQNVVADAIMADFSHAIISVTEVKGGHGNPPCKLFLLNMRKMLDEQ